MPAQNADDLPPKATLSVQRGLVEADPSHVFRDGSGSFFQTDTRLEKCGNKSIVF